MPLRPLGAVVQNPPFADLLQELVRLLVDDFTDGMFSTCPGFRPPWIRDCRTDDRQTSKSDLAGLLTWDTKMSKELRCHN
jgi:hypothetical protein